MGSNGERRTGRVDLSLITSWVSSTPLVSATGGQQSYAGCAEYGQRVRDVTALLCPHLHVHVYMYKTTYSACTVCHWKYTPS